MAEQRGAAGFGWLEELPGMIWRFTPLEVHVFGMALQRLTGYGDETFHTAQNFSDMVLAGPEPSGTTTSELYAFIEGFLPGARAHLWALLPEDPVVWKRVVSDPLLRIEMGVTEKEAEKRLRDAEGKIVRILQCDHTTMEHDITMLEWFDRNVVSARLWMTTLHRLWDMSPEERTPGKQFIARSDMELQIAEDLKRLAQQLAPGDQKDIDFLILQGQAPDEVERTVARRHAATLRDAGTNLRGNYADNFRILD